MDELGFKINRFRGNDGEVHIYRYRYHYTFCQKKGTDLAILGEPYTDKPATCLACRAFLYEALIDQVNWLFDWHVESADPAEPLAV